MKTLLSILVAMLALSSGAQIIFHPGNISTVKFSTTNNFAYANSMPIPVLLATHSPATNSAGSEEALFSASVATTAMPANGFALAFHYAGQASLTESNKRVRVKLGAATLFDSGAFTNAPTWTIDGRILRTGTNAAVYVSRGIFGTNVLASGATSFSWTTNNTLTLTSESEAGELQALIGTVYVEPISP